MSEHKLNEHIVASMKADYLAGESMKRIGDKYGVDARVVGNAVRGVTWKQVGNPIPRTVTNYAKGERVTVAKLTADKVRAIRRHLADGKAMMAIARAYGVTDNSIRQIRDGITWTHVQ